MQWTQLLSLRRQGDKHKRLRSDQSHIRSGFEVDYDRVIFSSAFRHLQDKTQVIPFSKSGFVHTRLTHSLEVSVVGRSLGRAAGMALLDRYPELAQSHGYQAHDFGAIVAAAALAHDIGNPPFGHSGEQAIGDFFKEGVGASYCKGLTDLQKQDLQSFEGNANGFKILTQNRAGVPGGLRLSYATLGAFTKYPKPSLPHRPTKKVSDKKFGYFQAQAPFFDEVAQELGLTTSDKSCHRHPLAFLVEAADDICYTLIDFEDGINLGWIAEEYALEYLIKLVQHKIDTPKYNQLTTTADRLAYLRALSVGALIEDALRVFMENESEILKGQFGQALLDKSQYKAQIDDIIQLSIDKIYRSDEVIKKEFKGYKAIHHILEVLTTAVVRQSAGTPNALDRLALQFLPETLSLDSNDRYQQLLQISCFVAGLTDGQALAWHQKMS